MYQSVIKIIFSLHTAKISSLQNPLFQKKSFTKKEYSDFFFYFRFKIFVCGVCDTEACAIIKDIRIYINLIYFIDNS